MCVSKANLAAELNGVGVEAERSDGTAIYVVVEKAVYFLVVLALSADEQGGIGGERGDFLERASEASSK